MKDRTGVVGRIWSGSSGEKWESNKKRLAMCRPRRQSRTSRNAAHPKTKGRWSRMPKWGNLAFLIGGGVES